MRRKHFHSTTVQSPLRGEASPYKQIPSKRCWLNDLGSSPAVYLKRAYWWIVYRRRGCYLAGQTVRTMQGASSYNSIPQATDASTPMKSAKHRSYSTPTEPLGLGILKRKYNRRWWMLFVSSLLNVANSAVWIAVPTVQKLLVQEYEVDQHAIVQLTNIAYLLYVPGSILGFFILEKGGVAISTGVGGALLTICCLRDGHDGARWNEAPRILLGRRQTKETNSSKVRAYTYIHIYV